MQLQRRIAIVGSRAFTDYDLLDRIIRKHIEEGDMLVSGGAKGADSMAQRWAKENGYSILIHYPNYGRYGIGAAFIRNERIVEDSDLVLAFYAKGRFGQGGTANSAKWARKLEKPLEEYEQE